MDAAGIVLCGGLSRRMGRPKDSLPLGAETLLQRIVQVVAEFASPVIVAARPGQELPSLPRCVEVVHDRHEGCGPLAGMAAAFGRLTGRSTWAFVTACDHVRLRPAFALRLIEAIADAPAVIPEHNHVLFPLTAVYRIDLLSVLHEMLAEGAFAVHSLVARCGARIIPADQLRDVDPNLESLVNINDPRAYEQVLRDA
jgi:molybdopterin-guanine dinucleotide biosynthesis protein A